MIARLSDTPISTVLCSPQRLRNIFPSAGGFSRRLKTVVVALFFFAIASASAQAPTGAASCSLRVCGSSRPASGPQFGHSSGRDLPGL